MPGVMKLDGESQGRIEGSSGVRECENCIRILAIDHLLEVPVSSPGQAASGSVVHRPLSIIKPIDASTPKLYQALCEGELLEVDIGWYRPNANAGGSELFYSIKLSQARIQSIHPYAQNLLDENHRNYPFAESVGFTYRKINWVWEPRGIEYENQWGGEPR